MEALGIDIKLLIAQLVNFLLFFYIFKRFLATPFSKFLLKEKLQEEEKERLLHELEQKEQAIESNKQEILEEAREKARNIIAEAEEQANAQKETILKTASQQALSLKEKTKKQTEEEKQQMLSEVKEAVLQTSSRMVKLALQDFLDEPLQKKLTAHLAQRLKKEKIYEN